MTLPGSIDFGIVSMAKGHYLCTYSEIVGDCESGVRCSDGKLIYWESFCCRSSCQETVKPDTTTNREVAAGEDTKQPITPRSTIKPSTTETCLWKDEVYEHGEDIEVYVFI